MEPITITDHEGNTLTALISVSTRRVPAAALEPQQWLLVTDEQGRDRLAELRRPPMWGAGPLVLAPLLSHRSQRLDLDAGPEEQVEVIERLSLTLSGQAHHEEDVVETGKGRDKPDQFGVVDLHLGQGGQGPHPVSLISLSQALNELARDLGHEHVQLTLTTPGGTHALSGRLFGLYGQCAYSDPEGGSAADLTLGEHDLLALIADEAEVTLAFGVGQPPQMATRPMNGAAQGSVTGS